MRTGEGEREESAGSGQGSAFGLTITSAGVAGGRGSGSGRRGSDSLVFAAFVGVRGEAVRWCLYYPLLGHIFP